MSSQSYISNKLDNTEFILLDSYIEDDISSIIELNNEFSSERTYENVGEKNNEIFDKVIKNHEKKLIEELGDQMIDEIIQDTINEVINKNKTNSTENICLTMNKIDDYELERVLTVDYHNPDMNTDFENITLETNIININDIQSNNCVMNHEELDEMESIVSDIFSNKNNTMTTSIYTPINRDHTIIDYSHLNNTGINLKKYAIKYPNIYSGKYSSNYKKSSFCEKIYKLLRYLCYY